jgi:hypothetical protein
MMTPTQRGTGSHLQSRKKADFLAMSCNRALSFQLIGSMDGGGGWHNDIVASDRAIVPTRTVGTKRREPS